MENMSLQVILAFLKENDRVYDENPSELPFSAVLELLSMVKALPDREYRLKGSFKLYSFQEKRYDLFYIPDMVLFSVLLSEKKYNAFFHEVHDFLYFKITQEGKEDIRDLPLNIKYALIEVLERSRNAEEDTEKSSG